MMPNKTIKLGTLYRTLQVKAEDAKKDSRTMEISFSSEDPYLRWGWDGDFYEILGHEKTEIDLSWIGSGRAPFLADHNMRDQVGIIEKAWVGEDRKGRAQIRFGKSARAEEILQDVLDGIRTNISVGYIIDEMKLMKSSKKGPDEFRVTKWTPLESSIVSIPADTTVGIGREDDHKEHKTIIIKEVEKMSEEIVNTPVIPSVTPVIDEKALRVEIAKKEMGRIKEINALGDTHSMPDIAREAISSGTPVDIFREQVLDKLAEKGVTPVTVPDADIGMTPKEIKQFSFLRAIRALSNPSDRKLQDAAAFEFEASIAVSERTGKAPEGLFVPTDVLKKDMSAGIATAGGYLVDEVLMAGSFIETLENAMVIQSLGTTTLSGLVGDLAIPKQTGGATGYWLNEGASPTESQPTLGQVLLTPKTVGAYTDYTRKLMLQSSISVENFVRADLALRLALQIDLKAINGLGAAGEPRGILNTAGIGSVTLNATNAPDWGDIVDMETAVAIDNALVGSLHYISNATIQGNMKQTEKAANTAKFILEDGRLNGHPYTMTNQMPTKYMIFGNFRDLILGFWGGLDINVDKSTLSTSGGTRVIVLQDVDVAVRHAESFAKGYKV